MTPDHEPPQLTSEGEQLLADVLRRRKEKPRASPRHSTASGHDTVAARANRTRRERDSLRTPPAAPRPAEDQAPNTASRLPVLVFAGASLAVALVLTASWLTQPTIETEVAGATEVVVDTVARNVEEDSQQGGSAEERALPDADPDNGSTADMSLIEIDPALIEVSVYDEDPAIGGVYSFALRIKSLDTATEIDTNLFAISVEDETGTQATTFSRFIHGTLPVGSSALATVRAEGAGTEQQFVVVRVGEVEMARIAIGN